VDISVGEKVVAVYVGKMLMRRGFEKDGEAGYARMVGGGYHSGTSS